MLKSLKIKNFRCFEEFDLQQLGRINLLVGKNNSGKTSILEALHVLNSPDDIKSFLDIIDFRGEYNWDEEGSKKEIYDMRHLFCHHLMNDESSFEFSGTNNYDKIAKFSFNLTSIPPTQLLHNHNIEAEGKKISVRRINAIELELDTVFFALKWEDTNDSVFVLYLPTTTIKDSAKFVKNRSQMYLKNYQKMV